MLITNLFFFFSFTEKGGEVGDSLWCSDDEEADADSGNGVGPDGA